MVQTLASRYSFIETRSCFSSGVGAGKRYIKILFSATAIRKVSVFVTLPHVWAGHSCHCGALERWIHQYRSVVQAAVSEVE